MKLSRLLENVDVEAIIPALDPETEVGGASCDSREVRPGFIFVANRGKLLNGEDFAMEAAEKGAIAVVTANEIEGLSLPQILVPNTREALSLIAANLLDHPAEKLKMIGITGSNGKTSTAFMVDKILAASGQKTGLLGTIFARTGKSHDASILTTPDSTKLQRFLSEMVESGFTACTMEVSSIGIQMRRVYGIRYDVFAFINISREHIDDHGDFETYFNLKASMVRGLSADSLCILNADDPLVYALRKETAAKVLLFSVKEPSEAHRPDVYIKNLDISTGRGRFTLVIESGSEGSPRFDEVAISMNVSGFHNVVNAVAAATIAHAAGIGLDAIKAGLEAYTSIERRFECIYDREFKIFDDHYANPGNIAMTMETMHRMDIGKLIMCYAVRGSRGTTVNRENVEAMLPHLKRLGVSEIVATESVETVGSKDVVTEDEKTVFLELMKAAGIKIRWHERLTDAVKEAVDMALACEAGKAAGTGEGHGLGSKGSKESVGTSVAAGGSHKEGVGPSDVLLLAGCQGMDSGGHIALNYLAELTGDKSVLDPIKERVCGFLPMEKRI